MWVFSSVAAILDFWVFSSVAAILDFSDNGVELVRYDATGGERAVSLVYFLHAVFSSVYLPLI